MIRLWAIAASVVAWLLPCTVVAQADSLLLQQDTSAALHTNKRANLSLTQHIQLWPRPKKAFLASLVLPGAGQVFNRKWWKLPIVAGGFITGGAVIGFNRREYNYYRRVLYERVVNNYDPLQRPDVSDALVRQVRDTYGRRYQSAVLLTGLFYFLVAADAFVDAHLYSFDVSDDLSLHLTPSATYPGIGLAFNYHKKAEPLRALP